MESSLCIRNENRKNIYSLLGSCNLNCLSWFAWSYNIYYKQEDKGDWNQENLWSFNSGCTELVIERSSYLILISSLIAYPIAYFGSKYWLEGFADKVKVNPLIFVLATLVALAIGWLSISYQTIKAANYNPARALRIE